VELTIRVSLGYAIYGSLRYPYFLLDDLAMRSELLAELRHLDLVQLKKCHQEDVHVALFLDTL